MDKNRYKLFFSSLAISFVILAGGVFAFLEFPKDPSSEFTVPKDPNLEFKFGSELEPDSAPEVDTQALCKCLKSKFSDNLLKKDVERIDYALKSCITEKDPERFRKSCECLPLDLGIDSRNGKTITVKYSCSDVCPDQQIVFYIYKGVPKTDCCALPGYPMRDFAWGNYLGCIPTENGFAKARLSTKPNACEKADPNDLLDEFF